MADDDLIVRAAIRDELSGPLEEIRDRLDDVRGAANRADRATSSLGGGMGKVASSALGFARGAGRIALDAVGKLTTGLAIAAGAAVVFGVKTAAAMENADIAFTTMLGSGKKARVFLDQLKAFAAKTPFEFPELQTAASSLISAGVEANKVIPIMTSLGNATSGMGTGSEGVQRATVALQQMNAAGKITGEDLNQLRDAGIPVFDLLAAATGKSKKEVAALAQAGKLGGKELGQLMKALETGKGLERFSGLMNKQSASLSGMFSTLKDTLGQGLANAIGPSIPFIKRALGAISNGAASAFNYLKNNKGEIVSVLHSVQNILKGLAPVVKAAFGGFSDGVSGGKGALKAFADFMATNQANIIGFIVGMGSAAINLGIILATVASGALRAFAGLSDGVGFVLDLVLKEILVVAATVEQALRGVGLDAAADKAAAAVTGINNAIAHNKVDDGGAAQARSWADALDNKLIPGLKGAKSGLEQMGAQAQAQAHLSDVTRGAARAVRDIGTNADGSQIKLKKWSDVANLGTTAQGQLKQRIAAASGALGAQQTALREAGAGQDALTAAWTKGKKRLYDEFIQMGLSKKEAGKLAAKYAGVKPKVSTKFETPGLDEAKSKAEAYNTAVRNVPKHPVVTWTVKADGSRNLLGGLSVGDTRTSHGHHGGIGRTLAGHGAAVRASGAHGVRVSNVWTGGGGMGRGSGDHQAGRALDLVGPGLAGYARAVRAAGGFAEYHGAGARRHLHAVPAGDTKVTRASTGGGGGGGVTMMPGAVQVTVSGSDLTRDDVAAAVQQGIRDWERDRRERR